MYILALDTTQHHCSVALLHNNMLFSIEKSEKIASHSEEILPLIEKILKANMMTYKDLYGIAVHRGPGSFIGIRVGLSAAKGLKLVTKLPLWGVDGFSLAAWKHGPQARPFIVMHNMKPTCCYMQIFDNHDCPVAPPRYVEFSEISSSISPDMVILGKDVAYFTDFCEKESILYHKAYDLPTYDAEDVAFYAWHHYNDQKVENLASLEALYVRPPDAILPSSI